MFRFLLLLLLLTAVTTATTTTAIYPCDCMLIEVSYDNNAADGSCGDTLFRYVFNNTAQCKDISNVVFGFGSDDIEFQTVDSTCVTEIGPNHSPGCNQSLFEHPWKFDFADGCYEFSMLISESIVGMGTIQYKAGTECYHCEVPVPKRCRDICIPPASAHSGASSRLSSSLIAMFI